FIPAPSARNAQYPPNAPNPSPYPNTPGPPGPNAPGPPAITPAAIAPASPGVPAPEGGDRVPAVRQRGELDQGPGQPRVDAVQVSGQDGHAVPQQPGGRAHGHRVESGQQRREERGGPDAGLPDPGGQQPGQLGGAP